MTEGLNFHFSLSCIGEGNGNPRTGEPGGCCLWGRTELDMTEATKQQQQQQFSLIKKNKCSKQETMINE